MYFSGITDEAGDSIDTQIAATKALGWRHLELRRVAVDGRPGGAIHDVPEDDFDRIAGRILDAGLQVSCFSSAIANWGKSILDPFDTSIEEARRCIPRMKKLGCRMVRIMSFQLIKDADGQILPPEQQHPEERFRRVRQIHAMFTQEGLIPVHENCMNYGGMGWTMTLELLEAVPGLALVFDTGNPVFALDFTRPAPRPRQDALEFYRRVRPHIAYVHIKDGRWNAARNDCDFTFPGEGDGHVAEILADLKASGYDGGISIEPHMSTVFHAANQAAVPEKSRIVGFIEYGRRLQALWER